MLHASSGIPRALNEGEIGYSTSILLPPGRAEAMTEPDVIAALPRRTAHALDLLSFSLADVRDGLGPYLSVYLLLTHHWDQASIGFVMAVGGIAGGVPA